MARAQSYAPILHTGHFFSHETAVSIWGGPLPLAFDDHGGIATADDLALHVSASGGIPFPRARGVTGHRTLSSLTSIRYRDGLRVSSPAATWVSLGTLPLVDLVALGDYFCRRWRPGVGRPDVTRQPWATIDELREMLAAGRRRGADEATAGCAHGQAPWMIVSLTAPFSSACSLTTYPARRAFSFAFSTLYIWRKRSNSFGSPQKEQT